MKTQQTTQKPRRIGLWILLVFLAVLAVFDVWMIGNILDSFKPRSSIYWGDNSESPSGRRSYTSGMRHALGEQPVLNSMSDNGTYDDERMFVGVRRLADGLDGEYKQYSIDGVEGETYEVRMVVINDNELTTAENVQVKFDLKAGEPDQLAVAAYVCTDNAAPTEYWSKVFIKTERPAQLGYVASSAKLANGAVKDVALNALDLVTDGVLIGYRELDGKLPGGSEYATVITLRIKVLPLDAPTQ